MFVRQPAGPALRRALNGATRQPLRLVLGQISLSRTYAQDFKIKRVLKLPKEHMYSVVADVAKYQEFVPYCLKSTITQWSDSGVPTKAMLQVGWSQLDETFESELQYTDQTVCARAADNRMFKELVCDWTVREVTEGQCMVALNLRFQFQNKLYDMMAQGAGPTLTKKMIEAFSNRAFELAKKQSV